MKKPTPIVVSVFSLFGFLAEATSLPTDGLQVQFRADDAAQFYGGAFPAAGAKVQFWSSEGESSVEVVNSDPAKSPSWAPLVFQRQDGTLHPAVRFRAEDGNPSSSSGHYLATAGGDETDLNLKSANSTWFMAWRNPLDSQWGRSIFGLDEGTRRFGAFMPSENTIRYHAGGNPYASGNVSVKEGFYLSDCRGTATRLTAYSQGTNVVGTACGNGGQTAKSQFGIGTMVRDVPYGTRMDVGELVVYNRALNDAECHIVREALAARWGVPNAAAVYQGAARGYADDLIGVGSMLETGDDAIPGAVDVSGNSAGLVIAANGSLAGTSGFVLSAHNDGENSLVPDVLLGARRFSRAWNIESTYASLPALTLTFDFGAAGLTGVKRADAELVRLSDAGVWEVVPGVTPEYASDGNGITTCSFSFSAGRLSPAVYTVAFVDLDCDGGADTPTYVENARFAEDLCLWYRADTGVTTNEAGKVTCWANAGTLGSAGDVKPAAANTSDLALIDDGISVARGGRAHAAVDFPGNAYLVTDSSVTIPCGINGGGTTLAVVRFSGISSTFNSCVFGGTSNPPRYGGFVGPYTHGYRGNLGQNVAVGDYWDVILKESGTAWSLYSTTATRVSGGAKMEVRVGEVDPGSYGVTGDTLTDSVTTQFQLGHFNAAGTGDISTWAWAPMVGQISEVRCYSRPLTATERAAVAMDLAVRYALPLETSAFPTLVQTSSADYSHAIVGTGVFSYDGAHEEVPVSSSCGGLMLSRTTHDCSKERAVWAGHDGNALTWAATGAPEGVSDVLRRSWCIAGNPQTGIGEEILLSFELPSGESSESDYVLLYRASDANGWEILGNGVRQANLALFELTDRSAQGFSTNANGYYTLGRRTSGAEVQAPSAGVSNGLRGWWRADVGADSSLWQNLGCAGAVLDVRRAEGSTGIPQVSPQAFGAGVAGVTFPGKTWYETLAATDFDIVSDEAKCRQKNDFGMTWYAAFRIQKGQPLTEMAILGLDAETGPESNLSTRFGIFFAGNGGMRMHTYVWNNVNAYNVYSFPSTTADGSSVLAGGLRTPGSDVIMGLCNGAEVDSKSVGVLEKTLHSAKFYIGRFLQVNGLVGDIGEIRIYNRSLSCAERTIVEEHLAARYGIAMSRDALYAGAAEGYVWDVAGIGAAQGSSVARGEDGGGLSLSTGNVLADGDWILAGHAGGTNGWVGDRMSRTWYVSKKAATGVDVTFTFDLEKAGVSVPRFGRSGACHLLRQADGQFVDTGVAVSWTGKGAVATLPAADFAEGVYTLGVSGLKGGLTVIVK